MNISINKIRKINIKSIFISVIALILMIFLVTGSSFSWLQAQPNVQLNTGSNLILDASAGLNMDYNGSYSGSTVKLSDLTFAEASSIDGRNMFFPTVGSGITSPTSASGTNTSTNLLKFREACAGDINTRYAVCDLTMSCSLGATDVWFDSSSNCYYGGTTTTASPMRIAIYTNDGSNPIVFDPDALAGNPKTVSAVSSISNTDGTPTTATQTANAFSTYEPTSQSGTGTALFHLSKGEQKKVSVIVWLEGTDSSCVDTNVGKSIDLNIKFTSSWDQSATTATS
ncbi:MAG: hypothetical protein Q8876_04635 [Bacillota bacterium]|nr:hypothetical protein [Bacillota bacterium]